MFLATTALSEFWDPSQELLFLGPWCLGPGARALPAGLRWRMLDNPWDDRARFGRACLSCEEARERLLAELAAHLDAVLGGRRSLRYWRTLLGMWLPYHVQQMYDHYVHLQDALKAFPDCRSMLLGPESFSTPWDFGDFTRLMLSDAYHLQLYSHLLAGLRPDLPRRPFARPFGERAASEARGLFGLKDAMASGAAWALSGLRRLGLGEVLLSDLNMGRMDYARLAAATGLRALPYLTDFGPELRREPRWDEARMGLAALPARDEFERLLVASLPRHFPTLFLEGYGAARAQALRRLGRRPRLVFSATGLQSNDALKFAAAECAESGGEVRVIQHGGGYGMVSELPAERQERAVADRFYAWGWAELSRDPKVSDLPHPKICEPAPRRPEDGSILFVSAAEPAQAIRLSRGPLGSQVLEQVRRQEAFLKALPGPLRARLRLRLLGAGDGREPALAARALRLSLDDFSVSFEERLGRASVSVFDYPGTTLLQAAALDRPWIAFWNPVFWEARGEAEGFLDGLREAGIVFDDPLSAARRLAEVAPSPRAWWDAPPARRARETFRARFALGGAWLPLWRNELLRPRGGPSI